MKQGTTLPILISNVRSYPKIPLGRSSSHASSSSSIQQVLISSSCSNHIISSRLSFKKIKSDPWERLISDRKQQETTLKRNKSNVDSIKNKDIVKSLNEHVEFDETFSSSPVSASVRTNFDRLYEQMNDITLQLAEERFKHKQTQIKAEETLFKQLQDQEKRFQELQQRQARDHKIQLKEQENHFLKLLNEEQTQSLRREENLKNELEFVKKSLHTYKATLEKENEQILQMKISEALATMKKEIPKREEQINKQINDAIMNERKNTHIRRIKEMENIKKQHQNEIETLKKALADATVDQENLESLSKELTSVKLELSETKEHANTLSTQVKSLKTQHNETIQEFKEYRSRFPEKTKQTKKS